MLKWRGFLVCVSIVLGIAPFVAAQNVRPAERIADQGILLTPLRYLHRPGGVIEVSAALCVINTSNEGPQWFLLSSDTWNLNLRLGSLDAAFMTISNILASPDGKFLAVISVGEGHPILEVVNLPLLLQEKRYQVLHEFDPYPGVISLHSWNGAELQVYSNMLLPRRDRATGRVPTEYMLDNDELFALNALTGEIRAVSEGAKNPIEHYADTLFDQQAEEIEKDEALTRILMLDIENEAKIKHLLEILEAEQDPERINRILDELKQLQ